jgi:hypothetical protein
MELKLNFRNFTDIYQKMSLDYRYNFVVLLLIVIECIKWVQPLCSLRLEICLNLNRIANNKQEIQLKFFVIF